MSSGPGRPSREPGTGGPEPAPARAPSAALDGGARLWDLLTTYVAARSAFREVWRRYERRVVSAARRRNVRREDLVLPPRLLARLFDLGELERLRDRLLAPLRAQLLAVFGPGGDEGLLDTYGGHVFHEISILCEEHKSVGRFTGVHDPARYRELFTEVGAYYPKRLRRVRRFLRLGMARLTELLPTWGRYRVVVRSAYLFGEELARSAWNEGLEGLYARMYPQGRATRGLLEAARSFHAAGFDAEARAALGRALAAASAPAGPGASAPEGALVAEAAAFARALALDGPSPGATAPAQSPVA